MIYPVDATHHVELHSWIDSANAAETDFPPQNLPFGVFQHPQGPRIGVAIGDQLLDLVELAQAGLLPITTRTAVQAATMAEVMSLPLADRAALRIELSRLVTDRTAGLASNDSLRARTLRSLSDVEMTLPVAVGDYTDFYASLFHATNVGSMFRPDNPLLPNYKHVPIGYHGRASSLVVSGTPVRRPRGQLPPAVEGGAPTFGPCQNLDYELEIGAWIGSGNRMGEPIPIGQAESHLFGIGLLNDWSARDMQRWEYQPLGPFLAKNFASTLSPWIVTMEALAPFRVPAFSRPASDPQPLPYLSDPRNEAAGGLDVILEVFLASRRMRDQRMEPIRLSRGSFAGMYWTLAQLVTHHASNGCNLRPGDLLGSGTISGADRESRGCLLELTWNGEPGRPVPGNQRTSLQLPTGESRVFLADGDEIVFRASCVRDRFRRIGLGECRGLIVASG